MASLRLKLDQVTKVSVLPMRDPKIIPDPSNFFVFGRQAWNEVLYQVEASLVVAGVHRIAFVPAAVVVVFVVAADFVVVMTNVELAFTMF